MQSLWVWLLKWASGDFERDGKAKATEYYAMMTRVCKERGREYLDWAVEDGWGPLYKFLGKEVSKEPFPVSSAADAQFEKNMEVAVGSMVMRAMRNPASIVGAFVVVGGGLWVQGRSCPRAVVERILIPRLHVSLRPIF
jgi:Sulfotransferase domain